MLNRENRFSNPAAVASYAENVPRKVPGMSDLHRMAMLLLAEQAPPDGHILVIGAGGGLETRALLAAQPHWRVTGVDPSPAMLALARDMLVPFEGRVGLLEGTVEDVPGGPFDGAACLLTLHHIEGMKRLGTLQEIRRRLKPGARLVIAGHSAPPSDPVRWLARSVAFSQHGDANWEQAVATGKVMAEQLDLLTPDEEEEMLYAAGFKDVELFYAAFSFRGWVASAG